MVTCRHLFPSHGKKKGRDHNVKARTGENALTQTTTTTTRKAPARLPLHSHRVHSQLRPNELRPTQPPGGAHLCALPRPARSLRGLGGRPPQVSPSFLQVLLESLSGITLLSQSQQSRPASPALRAGGQQLARAVEPGGERAVGGAGGRASVLSMRVCNAPATAAVLGAHRRTGSPCWAALSPQPWETCRGR